MRVRMRQGDSGMVLLLPLLLRPPLRLILKSLRGALLHLVHLLMRWPSVHRLL